MYNSCMTGVKDDVSKLKKVLKGDVGLIEIFEELGSTNSLARNRLETESEGGLILARKQNAGRGRRGHTFFSPQGGLYMSLYFLNKKQISPAFCTLAAGTACVEGIRACTGIEPKIKWVNDIYLNNRKLGGILAESVPLKNTTYPGIIIGIGINLLQQEFPEDLKKKACALNVPGLDPLVLCASITQRLLYWLARQDQAALLEAYRAYSFLLGKRVFFVENDIQVQGTAQAIDADGRLVVADDQGCVHFLDSGEVHLSGWE